MKVSFSFSAGKKKQALGVLLSEQSQYYNPLLVLLPLCRGVTDTS